MTIDLTNPPGDTIKDILEERGVTREEFAELMGLSIEDAERLVDGTMRITTPVAFKLRRVLGSTTRFWLVREKRYRDSLCGAD